jgi:hypothetical protein
MGGEERDYHDQPRGISDRAGALYLRDGHIIRSIGDAIAYLREHEVRPGVDARDEVLHKLERAGTDRERQTAAEAFLAWAEELDPAVGSS